MRNETRHLRIDELLALRDKQGSAFARGHLEVCPDCRGELERLYQVQAALRALPTFTPSRDLWPRVASQLRRKRARRRLGYGVLGLASAAVLAGLVVLRGPAARQAVEEPEDAWVAESSSRDIGPMMARSQELESLLRVYRPESRVYDAPTALAVSALEDRIVWIDRMLAESRRIGLEREVLVGLWGERVEALETLVGLQAVQERGRIWR